MQLAIAKWGNSLALRLPSHVAKDANLSEGAPVELSIKDGNIVVTPVRKKYRLDDLLAQMNDQTGHPEVDWGAPEGDEAW